MQTIGLNAATPPAVPDMLPIGLNGQPSSGGGGGLTKLPPPGVDPTAAVGEAEEGVIAGLRGAYAQLGRGKAIALAVGLALVGVVAAAGKHAE